MKKNEGNVHEVILVMCRKKVINVLVRTSQSIEVLVLKGKENRERPK